MFSTFFNKGARITLFSILTFAGTTLTGYAVMSTGSSNSARMAACLVPSNALYLGVLDVAAQGACVQHGRPVSLPILCENVVSVVVRSQEHPLGVLSK